MGLIHAESVESNKETELAGIFTRSGQACVEGKSFFTMDRFAEQLSSFDGVVIASSTDSHVPLIHQCLDSGVPVMVEKPVALDAEAIREIEAKSTSSGVPVLCCYQRRFDPAFVSVRRQVIEGKIGQPQLLLMTSRDHPAPSTGGLSGGGSFFADFSTHDVDSALHLLGEHPTRIYATGSSFLPNYVAAGLHDTAVLVLEFASGALCVISNSRRTTYGYDIRAELLGSRGMLQVTDDPHVGVLYSSATGHLSPVLPYSFPERFATAYRSEFQHFVDLIKRRVPLEQITVSLTDCAVVADFTTRASAPLPSLDFTVPNEQFPSMYDLAAKPKGHQLGVVLIGGGRMGCVRANAVKAHPHAVLKYVVDAHSPTAERVGQLYGCPHGPPERLAEFLADPTVDAVFISTVSSTHAELVKQCAVAGKAIFVEKPLALTAAESLECLLAARAHRVPVYVGFQRRSDPHRLEAKRVLDSFAPCTAEVVHVNSRDAPAHNSASYLVASGSFFFDSLIHDIDEACWLAGDRPVEVYCAGSAWIPEIAQSSDHDCVVIALRFANGALAAITNHRAATYGYDQRIEVHAAAGMVQCGNVPKTQVVEWTAEGIRRDPQESNGILRYMDAYNSEVTHFLNLLLGEETQPRVLPADALFGSYIAEAAKLSLAKKARVRVRFA